jgi:hypothetical protein
MTIRRATQQIVETTGITEIADIVEIASSNLQIRKEKRLFHRPADIEKWCEIYDTVGHDLKECKTFLYRKKMPPLAQVAQEPHRGEHR